VKSAEIFGAKAVLRKEKVITQSNTHQMFAHIVELLDKLKPYINLKNNDFGRRKMGFKHPIT